MPAPVASGWSDRRVGLAPTGKAPPCHGARRKPTFGVVCPSWRFASGGFLGFHILFLRLDRLLALLRPHEQSFEHGAQLFTKGGQAVFHLWRNLRIDRADDDAVMRQVAELLDEHLLRDADDPALPAPRSASYRCRRDGRG